MEASTGLKPLVGNILSANSKVGVLGALVEVVGLLRASKDALIWRKVGRWPDMHSSAPGDGLRVRCWVKRLRRRMRMYLSLPTPNAGNDARCPSPCQRDMEGAG